MQSIEEFFAGSKPFVALFDAFSDTHALQGRTQADHICYKSGSKESYERMRELFESEGAYIYQSIISKRRIAIVKFKQGIETSLGPINFLELSDQKPDNSQQDGFDHIEAYAVGRSYDDMVREFETQGERVVKVERPHHTTHDIDIGGGFLFRCTQGPLIEKIKVSEL
ncbi:MAG TPA: VOC family protein [Candidatus Paceibacterota bacterium]|nr:VOC family protein [Candidatus Paceibacterota bacterium]